MQWCAVAVNNVKRSRPTYGHAIGQAHSAASQLHSTDGLIMAAGCVSARRPPRVSPTFYNVLAAVVGELAGLLLPHLILHSMEDTGGSMCRDRGMHICHELPAYMEQTCPPGMKRICLAAHLRCAGEGAVDLGVDLVWLAPVGQGGGAGGGGARVAAVHALSTSRVHGSISSCMSSRGKWKGGMQAGRLH